MMSKALYVLDQVFCPWTIVTGLLVIVYAVGAMQGHGSITLLMGY